MIITDSLLLLVYFIILNFMMTEEAESPEVISKRYITIQLINRKKIEVLTHFLEYKLPFSMTIILINEKYARLDITKQQLAEEMRGWLNGKRILTPCLITGIRLETSMMNFVKFGKTPIQSDLFLWILGRCEVNWSTLHPLIFFGGRSETTLQRIDLNMNDNNDNDNNTNGSDELQKIKQGSCMIPEKEIPSSFQNNSIQNNTFSKSRPSSAPHQRTSRSFNSTTNDFGTFEVTKSLLGKSHAMEQLSKQKVKGREAAKTNYVTLDWTEDQFRLVKGIKERRQDVEDLMEQRRKVLEISQERQKRTMERYRKIREGVKQQRDNYNWTKNASYEVMSLDKIGDVIKEETKQQHCNTQRAVEHIRYTMAPNGFANRRGKSVKGYVIGSGPLPANATTCLQDPRIVQTMKRFQWDEFGRRHFRTQDDIAETNDVKQAMEVIRKASANVSLYKLNIKQVFEDMDVSKDGFLSISEMENAFKCMGVALTETSLQALFKYKLIRYHVNSSHYTAHHHDTYTPQHTHTYTVYIFIHHLSG